MGNASAQNHFGILDFYHKRAAMAVIDYGLGATERLKAKGITLHAILPISSLLGLWLEGKKITTEQYDMIMAFLNEMKLKLPVVQ